MRVKWILFGWLLSSICAACSPGAGWDDWTRYAERFVQADGRVIDLTFDQKSTSEGQSYGLFFALVANDRPRFDAILNWTALNLADGQLATQLPGWLWGRRDDGSWGIKDTNSAADGDLWTAYALLEAGRLWKSPVYSALGRNLLDLAAQHEIADVGNDQYLLPAPLGFKLDDGRLRVDPSYVPPFQFRYFGTLDPKGPWMPILDTYQRRMPDMFRHGIAPDLVRVAPDGAIELDPERPTASYDAIRVYLWAAMSGRDGVEQLPKLRGFVEIVRERKAPPEKIDVASGKPVAGDYSPIGFMAAALPYLQAVGEQPLADALRTRLKLARTKSQLMKNANYYDESLVLFALGYLDGYYRFDDQGRLLPRWAAPHQD
ncbi:MAG: 1,4-D-glucanase [Hydrocarboniphaga sp.]|uniref:cellulose synthase complex periplasmic endoglucanase BcsZ n=1 Tax=Hydrocarboniphaga sp. TaxID=2033016 RepID=UPI002620312E|nr:cellulose synthase complex periplasmic endoglucanase BcsZ [Hydrocarboniphaga sp.]MDB5969090.1 1,4-D-glucanase [Hydrocarboniphaga sp.]